MLVIELASIVEKQMLIAIIQMLKRTIQCQKPPSLPKCPGFMLTNGRSLMVLLLMVELVHSGTGRPRILRGRVSSNEIFNH